MEAFLASPYGNVLLGVVGNVLTEILFYMRDKGYEALKREEPLKPHLDTTLTPILQKAVAAIARSTQSGDEQQRRRLQMFLASPEVEAVVRQIYASKLLPEQGIHSESIRAEFSALLLHHLDRSQQSSANFTFIDELFDSLLQSCEQALQVAINRGVLVAHEAKSATRFHMLHDELVAIQKNIDFLTGHQQPNIQSILEFEQKYRQQIPSRHGYITPPNFDTARKLLIDKLYVCASFISTPRNEDERPEKLKINDFYSVIYRAVLLGNPGGGKSTFTDKLCNDLAAHYSEKLLPRRQVTPIHVILRDYGAAKKESNCSILEFIQTTAVSKYQLSSPPVGTFEYLLLNGRTIVVFDGLDELLDTSYRQTISGDVESFCSLYPSVPVLVTSREVGYKEAPLDEEKFEIFRLSSFDNDQVKEYVEKWFLAIEPELEGEQHERKVKAFLDESKVVPDLRSNPLMLALLCNIYRGEGYIPRNRPDVYEKCAVMLFERWDRSRGIQVSLPFESRIIFAMMYLAHWIYTNETLQGGVTERELITKATDYLSQRQYEDRDEAEKAACEFIEFCRGRAWVFTDTGTRKEGERLYQFTHRTFLEYFTSSHLVRISRTPENLQETLLPRIARREWDVVAQLAFRIQDKQTEEAGDELLAALVEKSYKAGESEKWNLLSFASRCLEFMVPKPGVRRDIATACVEFCIRWGLSQIESGQLPNTKTEDFDVDKPARELMNELLSCLLENRTTIADSLKELITQHINDVNDDAKSFVACEIGLHLYFAIIFSNLQNRNSESAEFWRGFSDSISENCYERILSLCPKYYQLCVEFIYSSKRRIPISDIVHWHGISCLFKPTNYIVFSGVVRSSVAESVLYNLFSSRAKIKKQDQLIANLNEMGQAFISSSLPLIRGTDFSFGTHLLNDAIIESSDKIKETEQLNLPIDALFAVFVLLAVLFEITLRETEANKDNEFIIAQAEQNQLHYMEFFRHTLLSRFKPVDINKVQDELQCFDFTVNQLSLINQWTRREINFVEPIIVEKAIRDSEV